MKAFRTLTVPAAAVFLAMPNVAFAIARTPTISGNAWVALGIIGFFIGTIYMLIMGALHVERRDADLRRSDHSAGGFFGILQNDDEDPGHPHHNG